VAALRETSNASTRVVLRLHTNLTAAQESAPTLRMQTLQNVNEEGKRGGKDCGAWVAAIPERSEWRQRVCSDTPA
jgi:hypothetical protein